MLKMSRHILVTICVLAASTFALKAQDYQSSIRKWDDGPLIYRIFWYGECGLSTTMNPVCSPTASDGTSRKRDTATSCTTETPRKPPDGQCELLDKNRLRHSGDTEVRRRSPLTSSNSRARKFQNEADTSSTNFLTLQTSTTTSARTPSTSSKPHPEWGRTPQWSISTVPESARRLMNMSS